MRDNEKEKKRLSKDVFAISSLMKENSPNKLLASVCESWEMSMVWDS